MSESYCSLEMTFTSAPMSTLQLMGTVCDLDLSHDFDVVFSLFNTGSRWSTGARI